MGSGRAVDRATRLAADVDLEDLDRQYAEEAGGKPNGTAAPLPDICPIDFRLLPDQEPPPRRFLIDQWLPDGCLSSLYGPGGVGIDGNQVATAPVPDRYLVNLPVNNPAGRLALTLLDSDYVVDLEISAAQTEGRGEIVSAPRVITANGKEASIEQGVEIPYQESASSGATTTQFKKAVLSLKVTPQITPDDRVILDLVVTKDSVGQLVPSATGGFVPSIDTRNIQTQVLVRDGQTVVLGGIMETERRESEKKVPGLGDVPLIGRLFKTTSRLNNRDELLIFITPKILREGASVD